MASFAFNAMRSHAPFMARAAKALPSAFAATRNTMPPGFSARVAQLETFVLPEKVTGSTSDINMASAMINAWHKDGILQIAMSPFQELIYKQADATSRRFFARPSLEKLACMNDSSYAGYIASGEEVTGGIADYSEVFTVTKDLQENDPRVERAWPCHGPCPWPDSETAAIMKEYVRDLGRSGETILSLIEMGLGVREGSLTKYTDDGWHHMRVLRFPPQNATNGKGKAGRGIGPHTDYGLLVIAAQDQVGGLFVRAPQQGEKFTNWEQSVASLKENDGGWSYVPPVSGALTVFPGDMMQYVTNGHVQSTPHKVGLNVSERFAFAYFHEPNFRAVVKPLPEFDNGQSPERGIHYGTHFTNMALRNYPERETTKRLLAEGRYSLLQDEELRDTYKT